MLSYPTNLRSVFVPVSVFAAAVILTLGFSLMFRGSFFGSETAGTLPATEQNKPMPSLEGDTARQYIEQKGLSDSLGEAVAKARYKVWPVERKTDGTKKAQFEAENPRSGYHTTFNADGTAQLAGGSKDNRWETSLRLVKFGRGNNLKPIGTSSWTASENRAENRRESIVEWYENESSGLEHGFTIDSKPESTTDSETQELRVALKIGGNLRGRLDENGQTLTLGTGDLQYSKLKVWDASGAELSSRMELAGRELSIVVKDTAASYPITIDPVFEPVKKLTASDGAANDQFGSSVSISGDTVIIGAYGDDDQKGAAYIFKRNAGGTANNWGEVKKITAFDGAAGDFFGTAAAISGDTVIVGAYVNNSAKGAAYIFERNMGGANNWGLVKKVTASDLPTSILFGFSVSISGDSAIVGATGNSGNRGAAYIYERNTGGANNWGEVKKLSAFDGTTNELFGSSVSISNDTVVVGASSDDARGGAYIFERNMGGANNWDLVKKITASDGAPNDRFGESVAISGDIVIVGAIGDDLFKGSAYIYERNTGGTANNWGQVKKIIASDGAANDSFGASVSISVDTIIVGARGDDSFKGSAYIYERNTGGADLWGQVKKLTASDGAANDSFGGGVSISNGTVIVGAAVDDSNKGSAHIFASTATDWVEIKKYVAPDVGPDNYFGDSVLMDGDTAVVGAYRTEGYIGSAYIFERNTSGANSWGLVKRIAAFDGAGGDFFGQSVAISGDTIIIGSRGDDDNTGSAYIYERNMGGANNWGLVKKISASDGATNDYFGWSVAISGDTAIVGTFGDNDGSGSAYILERNMGGADNWGEVKKLTASDSGVGDSYGVSVSISIDTAIVGAFNKYNAGAAYIYERNTGGANNWGEVKIISGSGVALFDFFGRSVAISGDTLIVSSDGANNFTGSAYIFERNTGGANNWGEVKKLTAADAGNSDQFGASVSISGDTVIVGSSGNDGFKGAAYIYEKNTGGADNWGLVRKIIASDSTANDLFGYSVSISGDTVIIGAAGEDNFTGSSYVFNAVTAPQTADLTITKIDSPDPVTAGSNLTYTITATNNGPDPAASTSFSDTLPAGTTFVSLPAVAGWSCTTPAVGAGGTISCLKSSFIAGSAVFTLTVNVAANTAAGTVLSNTATISSPTTDSDPGNNSGTATTTVAVSADLEITKTDSPDPVTAGNNITYTLNFINNGTSDAQNVMITDMVPANTTFVSAVVTTGSGWAATNPAAGGTGNVVFSKAAVPAGEAAAFQLVVKVNSGTAAGTTITNNAAVASSTPDPAPGNNSAAATTTVSAAADLAVTKTDTPDPIIAGNNITYAITLINNGPSDAQTVSLTDAVPADTTFVSAQQNSGPTFTLTTPAAGGTGNITATSSTLAAGASATFQIIVNVNSTTAAGTAITNSAAATAATTDPIPGNNTAMATTSVSTSADLSVTKIDTPDPVTAGNNLTYTITAANAGPSNAATVSLSDPLPAGTTFVSLTSPGGWSCTTPAVGAGGTISCSNSSFAAGSAVFTLTTAVTPSVTAGTIISNTATVSSTTTDPVPGNNSATATTTVAASADVSVTKVDTPDPVAAGGNLTYMITAANAGPSNAASVSLSDTLPDGTAFVSLTAPGGWSCKTPAIGAGGTVSCSNSSFAAGNTLFTLTVAVAPSVTAGTILSNTATISSATTDPNPGNNNATAMTTVAASADLSVTKVDNPDPVTAGNNLIYTITAANAGPSDAATVSLFDTLPAGTTFVSLTSPGGWNCTTPAVGAGGIISCSNASFAAGSAVFTLTVNVGAGTAAGTIISNTATISSATTDPNSGNNSAAATTTVAASADLSVTKVDTPDPVTAGTNLTYTITAANNGPSTAASVALSDTLPAGTTFISLASPGGWSCTTPAVGAGGTISCSNSSFAAGNAVFTLTAAVAPSVTAGTVLSNTATISSATTDPTPGNNSAAATTTVTASADLAITKTDGVTTATPGGSVIYTITVSNAGPSNAPGAAVADMFSASLTATWTCAGAGGGTCTTSGNGNINNTVNLPSGGSVTYTVSAAISSSATGSLTNTATVTAPAGVTDLIPGNNSATDTDTLSPQADLSITKTDGVTGLTAGGSVTYTIAASNSGPSNVTGAIVADAFPASLTGVTWTCVGAGGGSCAAAGGGNINDTINLPSGGSVTYTAAATISPAATGTISNTATVTAPAGVTDPNPANNSATDTDMIAANADLSVTKSDSPDPVIAGNNIAYTLTVSNAGPAGATSAVLTDVIPVNTTYQSITAPMGWTCTTPAVNSTGTVSCTNASLGSPASAVLVLVVNVNTGTANGSVISNTATVSSTNPDPDTANNSATTTTAVSEYMSPAPTGLLPKALLVKPATGNTTAGGGVSDSSCVAPSGAVVAGTFADINQALGAAGGGDVIYVCPKYNGGGLVIPYIEQVSLGFTNLSVVGISDVRGSRAVIAANPSTATTPTTQLGTNYIVQIVATGVNFGNFVIDGAPLGVNFANTGIFNGIAVRRSGAFVFNNSVQNIRTTDTAANENGQGIAVFGAGTAGNPLEAGTAASPVNILNNVVQNYRSNGVNVLAGSSSAYAFVRGNYIIGNGANSGTVNQAGIQLQSGANGDLFNNRITRILDSVAGCSSNNFSNCSAGIRLNTTASSSTGSLRVRFNQISNTQTGIFAQDVQYVSMISNTISNSALDGINLRGSALNLGSNFNTINQNTIYSARRAGIFMGIPTGDASLGNSITQNTITDAFTGVANFTPSGNNTIAATGASANTFIGVNLFTSNLTSGNTNTLP